MTQAPEVNTSAPDSLQADSSPATRAAAPLLPPRLVPKPLPHAALLHINSVTATAKVSTPAMTPRARAWRSTAQGQRWRHLEHHCNRPNCARPPSNVRLKRPRFPNWPPCPTSLKKRGKARKKAAALEGHSGRCRAGQMPKPSNACSKNAPANWRSVPQ